MPHPHGSDAPTMPRTDPAGFGNTAAAQPDMAGFEGSASTEAPSRPSPPPGRALNRNRRWSDQFPQHDQPRYRDEPEDQRLGRAAPSLQRAWIDPEETPFEPIPRPGNPVAARLISWVFILLFIGGIAWLVIPEVSFRITNIDTIVLREGVLTAHPVPLAPTRPATVTELYVDASALPDSVLPKDTPIAMLEGVSQTSQNFESFELRAPFDARFVSVDSLVGAVTLPGTPVATVYDPSKMYIIATVRAEMLERLRRGMQVKLTSRVVDEPIAGTVISAVPLLGTDHEPTSAELVNIRIKPEAGRIADFVPGIRFDAVVDLSSAPEDAQPLVFTNAEHIEPAATEEPELGEPDPASGDNESETGASSPSIDKSSLPAGS